MVKSKKKRSSKDGIDRISNLPEDIISQILSLLPTENAVATSVLSTRWKFLWTSVTTFDFYVASKRFDRKKTNFSEFASRVLFQITPPRIQKFRFFCMDHNPCLSDLSSWITAVAPTVQEFDLSVSSRGWTSNPPMDLPLHNIYFNKLVVLKLQGSSLDFNIPAKSSVCFPILQTLHLSSIKFSVPNDSSISFPNLKILHLPFVEFLNEDSACKLFSSCPILEDLVIEAIQFGDSKFCFIISIPSLTSLRIDFRCNDLLAFKIQIDKLGKLKFLSVSIHALKAMETGSANLSSSFHNLKRLELEMHDCFEWSTIKNLVERTDNVEHLIIERWKTWNPNSSSYNSQLTDPLNVPKCLASQVTTISLLGMTDECPDVLELVRYFLKNFKVLQQLELCIRWLTPKRKLKLIETVSKFPKGSQTCQVVFT